MLFEHSFLYYCGMFMVLAIGSSVVQSAVDKRMPTKLYYFFSDIVVLKLIGTKSKSKDV